MIATQVKSMAHSSNKSRADKPLRTNNGSRKKAQWMAIGIGIASSTAGAQTNWQGSTSVVWEDPTNWSAGVPTASVDAGFNLNTYPFFPSVSAADSTLGLVFGSSSGSGSTSAFTISANGAGGSLVIGTDGINIAAGSGPVTISAPISFASSSTISANSTAAFNISGSISGPALATLTNSGTSQIILAGSNSFSGGINLNAGWITAGNANALGSGTLTVGSGALNASAVASANVPFFNVSSTAAVTIANNIVLPSPSSPLVYSLQKNSASSTTGTNLLLTGMISGGNSNMTLELNSSTASDGTTSFEFNNSNPSLTGTVRLNRGALILDNANAVGSSQIVMQSNPNSTIGNLDLNGSFTFANPVSMGTTAADTIGVPGTNNATLSNVFTTAVAWTKIGTGTLTLTGANAITAATTITAGTLQIGNGGTSGTLNNLAVTDNGTLAFNLSSGATYTGVISGTGSLSQLGAGTTILSAANTYTGSTLISAGTLQIGNGSATSSIALSNVTDNAALIFNEAGPVSVSGSIAGSGTVTQAGTGLLSFGGNTTYTGLTSVNTGALRLNGGTTQIGAINVSGGATLAITNNGTVSSVNATNLSLLSGSTAFNFSAGTSWNPTTPLLALSGGLSENGNTTINLTSGALSNATYDLVTFPGSVSGSGTFSLGALPGHDTGTLHVASGLLSLTVSNAGDTTKWSGAVNGVWDINTTQNWRLVNANTATTYMEGDTVLFDDTATGSTNISLGTTVNPTSVTFNNSSLAYTIGGSGQISGSASLLVQGKAPVILAEPNTYTGGTTIAAGASLQIGNGSSGSITGNVLNNGSLTFVPPVAGQTFASIISGSGPVAISGGNLLSLTAANTFTGGVNLSNGSVSISNAAGLGTGTFNVGAGAVNTTAVSSTNVPFFNVSSTAAFTFANNVSLPSPVTPLVYTIQKNSAAFNTGTNLLLTGNIGGGNPNLTLELNSNTASDYSTSFEFNKSNTSLTGIVRLNRGAIILDNANAIGTAQLVSQSNPNSTIGNIDLNGAFTFANPITMGTTANNSIGVAGTTNAALSGVFTTAVQWAKVGTGTLTLTGANAISAATNISAGTLQIGNGGTLGTLGNAAVNNSGVLAFNHSDNVTYSGVIGGTGKLLQVGTGVLSLTSNNTFTGSTIVSSGTLQLLGGTTQASAINVSSGAALTVTDTGTTSTVSDPGLNLGSGTTTLNFAAGTGWSTSIPLLSLTSGTLADSGTTTINLNSATPLMAGTTYPLVQYNSSTAATGNYVVGSVPGRGSAMITNSMGVLGITIVSTDITKWTGAVNNVWDINTTSNWKLANAGTTTTYMEGDAVLFDDSASTTSVSLNTTVNPGSVLFSNNSSNYTLSGSGSISGGASLTMQGSATTTLLTNNTYTGGTTISSGTLQIGNGGTTGAITGAIADNGTLTFNRLDTVVLTGAISGTGIINQAGTGTTIFNGAVNISGGLVISAGTAQIGNGGTTGSLVGPVTDNATLVFNTSNASTCSGSISGSGTVIQAGLGTTTFGGASTYNGGTLIQSGGVAISNTSALGTGTVTIGAGANTNTTYISAQPVALDLTPLGNGSFTFTNNIVLPAGTFAGTPFDPNNNSYYAIQMNGSGGAGNYVTLSGLISGGGPNTIFYLNNSTAGNSQSTWSITNSGNSFVGTIRLNRGSLSITSDGALGPDTNPVYVFDNATAAIEFQYSGNFGHPLGDGQNNVVLNLEGNSINMTGVVSGTTGYVVPGLGTLTLSAANTVQGGFDLQGPTLNINNPSALGTGTLQIDQFQGVFNSTLDNTSGAPITLTTNNAQIWTSDFTFAGTNSLNLGTGNVNMSNGSRTITVAANTFTIGGAISDGGNSYGLSLNGPGTLVLGGSNSYTGGTQVNSGTLIFGKSNSLPTNTSLSVSSNAIAMIANHGNGPAATLVASSLSNSGTIDVTNNSIVLHNGSISDLSSQITQGYNNGAWNGSSGGSAAILSSTAAADTTHLTAVGIATGFTSFEGSTVLSSDILIKYTYYGDTNLDGKVDGSDYSRIDSAFLMDQTSPGSITGWFNGDFNYDGVINGSDYTLIDNAFNTQGALIASAIAEPTAQISDLAQQSAVPEPATIGILGIGAVGLLGRRRRR